MRERASLVLWLPLGVALAAACSATGARGTGTGTGAGVTNGPSGAGAGSAAGVGGGLSSSSGAGGVSFTGAGNGGGVQGSGCSSDLQSVVDGKGDTIMTCPPDEGCSGGACVPACQASMNAQGSIGCDFWAPDPPFYDNGQGSTYSGACYAVFIANSWSRPAKITVSRGGQSFPLAQFGHVPNGIVPNITYDPIPASGLPPGQVAVLFLSHAPGASSAFGTPLTCPVAPALLEDAAISGSGAGSAFLVVSDTPVTAYDIMPYGGALSYLPSASLLVPSTSWGTNYYAVAPHPAGGGELWMLVVGGADGTTVTAAPAATLPGGGSTPPTLNAGQMTTFTVNAGQTLQWIGADPSGTVLQATHPIGVFTGSTYLLVATQTSPSGGGEDAAHQQIPQIKALGSEYVAPSIVTRLASLAPESIPYRLVGVVDGTLLTYDPAVPPGAPDTLSVGQIVEFETTSLFAVHSQDAAHPFGMTHYMPGSPQGASRADGCSSQPMFGGQCSLGDEDWVILIPPAQFLARYVFFTDPTYATTNLVLTRVKGTSGFADVTVDCLGSPVTGWQNVDTAGKYQVAYVDLVRGTVPVAQCNGSQHEAKSAGKFGVNVWGTDWFASYGYPAGGNVGSINNVVVPPNPQ